MAKQLSESAAGDMRKMMGDATSDPNRISSCVVAIVGKDGKPIFTHASGTRGVDTKEPRTMDSMFWIAW